MTTTLTQKAFADMFVYSGGGGGSCVNAQGFIQPSAAPRYDFDPITKAAKGLLIESSRTNLLPYASRFDSTAWQKSGVSYVPEAALAPNGRMDACKLIVGVGLSAGAVFIAEAATKPAVAASYVASVYVKAGELNSGTLLVSGASSADRVNVLFGLGTTPTTNTTMFGGFTGATSTIAEVGGGWRRVQVAFTSDASTSLVARIYPGASVVGDGLMGLYAWGAQVEAGTFASSFIQSTETFTARASKGSYYDVKGVLRYAAAGVARLGYSPTNLTLAPVLLLEGQRTNTLRSSGNMHLSSWQLAGATRATGYAAPDGTLSAVQVSGVPAGPFTTSAVATATVMTYSLYVRNVSRSQSISLLLRNATTLTSFTGAVCALADANPSIGGVGWDMRPVGNGWFRCTYTQATGITIGDTLTFYAGSVGGATVDNGAYQVWGAQLEEGTFATSYIPSTDTFSGRASTGTYIDSTGLIKTAAAGAARMTYNPADLSIAPWLLLENQSTNLVKQSEQLATAPWTGTAAATPATETFCGLPFWEIKKKTTGTSEGWNQGGLVTTAAGDVITGTVALLAGTSKVVSVGLYAADTTVWGLDAEKTAEVLSGPGLIVARTGALVDVTGLSATVPTVIRITRKYSAASPVGFYFYPGNPISTTIGDSIKATRVQVESGAAWTSYIPTTTAQVTRVADTFTSAATTRAADTSTSAATTRVGDVIRIDATKGWFNPVEGAISTEILVPDGPDSATRNILEFGDGTLANRFGIGRSPTAVYAYDNQGGVSGPSTGSIPVATSEAGNPLKLALAYGTDGLRFCGKGGAPLKAAMPVVPATSWLALGATSGGSNQAHFHVKSVAYFPQKLADADLTALTV